MSETFDAIILGTGHNALVLQAYLSRCGLRTLTLERATCPGGGLATIENPSRPGFFHNPHSFFHRGITAMPWYRDLELARYGVRYVEPELNVAMILADGRTLEWWRDIEKTKESFAEFSENDARSLRRWVDEFRPIVEQILMPEAQSPPLEPDRRRELLRRSKSGRRLLEISALSPLEFVTREFEHDTIRAGLLFFNGLREIDLRLEGFGHAIPALLASPARAQMCVGGSAALARGLVEDIAGHGGQTRCSVEIRQILIRDGGAAGVELATGEQIFARAGVVSGLNPQQTFLQLLPADAVPGRVREQAERFRYNLLAPLFALHLALDEVPRYSAAGRRSELADAFMTILGLERFQQFHEIVQAHERGEIPPTVAWGACPTLFDPSQAPPGKHTAFLWEKVPYSLRGDPLTWENEKQAHGRALLELWRQYAPNLDDSNVLDCFVLTPLDTEQTLPNMAMGDLLVGSFAGNQIGYNRPFAGAGRYRTSVDGLYLCGGSTHPGGNITGLCGYNAAAVIASDLAIKPWWNPPIIEDVLAASGS
jgi:phytoene dehydrogenase-like protein